MVKTCWQCPKKERWETKRYLGCGNSKKTTRASRQIKRKELMSIKTIKKYCDKEEDLFYFDISQKLWRSGKVIYALDCNYTSYCTFEENKYLNMKGICYLIRSLKFKTLASKHLVKVLAYTLYSFNSNAT